MPKKTPKTPGPQTKKAAPKGKPVAGKAKRILIVEDEKPLAHALELKLSHEGCAVELASTGEEALKKLQAGSYALVLLDLILPGIDGFTILEQLKGRKGCPAIVVLSNLGQDEDQRRAQELGAKMYLVKSNIPLSDIVKVVRTFL